MNDGDYRLEENLFDSNSARKGGAIYAEKSFVLLKANIFTNNQALYGGAVYVNATSSRFFENNIISNKADFGGGIFGDGGMLDIATTNNFRDNQAKKAGGGVAHSGCYYATPNTKIIGNEAKFADMKNVFELYNER